MDLWGITDIGKVRRQNQDVFKTLVNEEKNVAVFVVCDGMGGARSGNVASEIAAETFMRYMENYLAQTSELNDVAMVMADAVIAANNAVLEKSLRSIECAGMGTTLTAAISTAGGEVVVNIGDSRAYHITATRIYQVTTDHSVVEEMIARGDLTRAESLRHPKKNLITRALGTGFNEEPDVFFPYLDAGDYLLLCSDGLTNLVSDTEIMHRLHKGGNARECCTNLVELALDRGAPDNVTVVVYKKGGV